MKKRILGLALALVLVISLLPLTAFAAVPAAVKLYMWSPSRVDFNSTAASSYASSRIRYIYVVDNEDTTDDLTDKKFAYSTTEPAGVGYARYEYAIDGAGKGLVTLDFKDFDTTGIPQTDNGALFQVGYGTGDEYDTNITIEGTNKISGPWQAICIKGSGDTVISGSGSLFMHVTKQERDAFSKDGAGDLTIRDVKIKVHIDTESAATPGLCNAFTVNGNVVVDGAELELIANNGSGFRCATKRNAALIDKTITIQNGAKVKASQLGGQSPLLATAGTVTINNSSVELIANANNEKVLAAAPTIVGTYSEQKYSVREQGSAFEEKDYTAAAFDSNVRWLKLVHECAAATQDDGNCTTAVKCACGKDFLPAKTAHIAGANADDCTKDTICGNPGCTQVFEAKKGDAHVAGQDDGDCTTDILCSNTGCTQVATKGAEKHVWDRTSCAVAGTCTNTNCTKGIEAGTHSGGTATCKAKAKCAECGAEYGELGACAPAADDGDCTTAIKCTVCGKDTTAAKDAHKYTDKNDTTCDNAGCTNTRKVEGTENPKTGDNSAIAVVAALMVTAAAAFVTTKKFAR